MIQVSGGHGARARPQRFRQPACQVNIAHGGEWIETRLLTSGPRTNPWFQEAGDRVIEAGDLVSFDTDLIGPYGYCADISRSFLCGDGPASDAQRRLYAMAVEQIAHNLPLFRAGAGYREIVEKAYALPEAFAPNRYSCIAHGVGLCDEYPLIPYPQEFARFGHDGELKAGMTLCLESYIGAVGGAEGVKLEQQILITPDGPELLSHFPLELALLSGRGGVARRKLRNNPMHRKRQAERMAEI